LRAGEAGSTRLELMVATAVIVVIAAMVVPRSTGSRIASHEAAAIAARKDPAIVQARVRTGLAATMAGRIETCANR